MMLKKNLNFFVNSKFNIVPPKYMRDTVPLITDMEFKWIELYYY
jgi:hypothetical protein